MCAKACDSCVIVDATDLTMALEVTRTQVLTAQRGARPDADDIVVILTGE